MHGRAWSLGLVLALGGCAHEDELEALEPDADALEDEDYGDEDYDLAADELDASEDGDEDELTLGELLSGPKAVPRNRREARKLARAERKAAQRCDRARDDARADLDAGQPLRHSFGLPSNCHSRYARAVYDELGVAIAGNGCVITEDAWSYAECYNAVIDAHLDAEHGPGAMEAIWERECGD